MRQTKREKRRVGAESSGTRAAPGDEEPTVVVVEPGMMVFMRSREKYRAYQREYHRNRRARERAQKAAGARP
jgi:hypothetical protein